MHRKKTKERRYCMIIPLSTNNPMYVPQGPSSLCGEAFHLPLASDPGLRNSHSHSKNLERRGRSSWFALKLTLDLFMQRQALVNIVNRTKHKLTKCEPLSTPLSIITSVAITSSTSAVPCNSFAPFTLSSTQHLTTPKGLSGGD